MSVLMAMGLTACYSDDSSMGDASKVGSIEVAEMPTQSIVSYAGNCLKVTPEIKSSYADSDLEYSWYIYQERKDQENGFRKNCISHDRNLNYEVNLSSGAYTVALEVKSKSTGLTQLANMTLNVTTEFSDCFYILKETADGKSELDIVSESGLSADLIKKMTGAPMAGKPVNLSMLYGQQCVDPVSEEMIATNTINVFSDREYYSFRTEDMMKVFDSKSITFAGEDNTDKYLNIVNGYWYAFLISDTGVSAKFYSEDMGLSTGKFGMPSVPGNFGMFMQMLKQGSKGMAVWDNDSHGISSIDYNCSYTTPITSDPTGTEECMASGINRIGGNETVWFLSQSKVDGKRFLYLINSKTGKLTEKKELNSSLHISKASVVAACGGSAAYIYVIDGGKLYGYGWTNDIEVEIQLPGVSGNVSFVTNQWMCNLGDGGAYDFDNLIVGSQNGDNYTLYFFDDLVGGVPNSKPYKTVSGTGKLKCIRRSSPTVMTSSTMFMSSYGALPIFPTSE